MIYHKYVYVILLSVLPFYSFAQLSTIDHWETAVFETDTWHYFVGNTAPPSNWNQPSFNPSVWQTGQGGIGYADNDDNTIIPATVSLYMRLNFNIIDINKITAAIFHADYDDAFVAYLNGHEIARDNIGTVGTPPTHTESAITYKEAQMYAGGNPSDFLLTDNDLNQYLNQGSNTLAIQVHNYGITSSDLSARFFFSVGINDTSTDYSPVPSWFVTPFVASNLPIIKINTGGQNIPQEVKITADMEIIYNGTGNINYVDGTPNEYNGKIGIEMRGASSTMFPKNGYGVETRDAQGNNNNVSLFGMPSENDWVLHGPYADKSLLRNYLTYHIGSRLGHYTPRIQLCEVFLDNQYWGVYLFKEKIKRDKNRVDIAKLSPTDTLGNDLTGGYIFKIDRDDGPDNGWFANTGYGYYAYHHPNADDLHPLQKAYIKSQMSAFETVMASSNYNNPAIGYPKWLDVPSFIDYMMIQEITRNIDAYRLSTFMYKKRDSDGGKIHAGPIWDFNLGFGNEDFCDNGNATGWAFNYNQVCGAPFPDFWNKLVNDAGFRDDFHCRWQELRSTVLNTDTIHHFIDSMVLETNDARIRNFERWNVIGNYVWPNAYIGNSYAQEITYLKNWITQRMSWMDANMIGNTNNCVTSTEELENKIAFRAYPNPFTEYLAFEWNGQKPITIELYDVLGKVVKRETLNSTNSYHQFTAGHLTQGIYFYAVYEEGQLVSKGKLVKADY